MKKILTLIALSLFAGLFFCAAHNIMTTERIDWAEGQCQVSPSKEWTVFIQSTSTPALNKSYCKVFIFNTSQYPNLKESGQFPTITQKNNPKAAYLLPIQFYAREIKFEWAPDNSYVILKQGSLNGNPPLSYKIVFATFSLNEIIF
jgi:hypothetical protein